MIMWGSEIEDRNDKRHESSIITTNDSHNFTGFSEDAFYVFWVVALNEFGSSEPSDVHDFNVRLESIREIENTEVIEVWLIVLIVICAVIFLLICCLCCFFCFVCCCANRQRVYFAEKEGTAINNNNLCSISEK